MGRPLAAGGAPASITATGQDGIALFRKVYEKALETYVDAPDEAKVMEGAINGMLASLDPHSNYLDPKALSVFRAPTPAATTHKHFADSRSTPCRTVAGRSHT